MSEMANLISKGNNSKSKQTIVTVHETCMLCHGALNLCKVTTKYMKRFPEQRLAHGRNGCFQYLRYSIGHEKVREKSREATITNRSPSQTPRGRGNRQIQTSTNRTNVRKTIGRLTRVMVLVFCVMSYSAVHLCEIS